MFFDQEWNKKQSNKYFHGPPKLVLFLFERQNSWFSTSRKFQLLQIVIYHILMRTCKYFATFRGTDGYQYFLQRYVLIIYFYVSLIVRFVNVLYCQGRLLSLSSLVGLS